MKIEIYTPDEWDEQEQSVRMYSTMKTLRSALQMLSIEQDGNDHVVRFQGASKDALLSLLLLREKGWL